MLKTPLMEQLRKCANEMRSMRSRNYLELIIMDVIMNTKKPKHMKVIWKIWKQL